MPYGPFAIPIPNKPPAYTSDTVLLPQPFDTAFLKSLRSSQRMPWTEAHIIAFLRFAVAHNLTTNVRAKEVGWLMELFGFSGADGADQLKLGKEKVKMLAQKVANATKYAMSKHLAWPIGPVIYAKDQNRANRAWYPRSLVNAVLNSPVGSLEFVSMLTGKVHGRVDLAWYVVGNDQGGNAIRQRHSQAVDLWKLLGGEGRVSTAAGEKLGGNVEIVPDSNDDNDVKDSPTLADLGAAYRVPESRFKTKNVLSSKPIKATTKVNRATSDEDHGIVKKIVEPSLRKTMAAAAASGEGGLRADKGKKKAVADATATSPAAPKATRQATPIPSRAAATKKAVEKLQGLIIGHAEELDKHSKGLHQQDRKIRKHDAKLRQHDTRAKEDSANLEALRIGGLDLLDAVASLAGATSNLSGMTDQIWEAIKAQGQVAGSKLR